MQHGIDGCAEEADYKFQCIVMSLLCAVELLVEAVAASIAAWTQPINVIGMCQIWGYIHQHIPLPFYWL